MDAKEKLEKLRTRLDEIKPMVSKSFPAFSGELEKYRDQNIDIFNEYYDIREQIQQLEWELMSPEEQSKKLKEREISKLKREGKL